VNSCLRYDDKGVLLPESIQHKFINIMMIEPAIPDRDKTIDGGLMFGLQIGQVTNPNELPQLYPRFRCHIPQESREYIPDACKKYTRPFAPCNASGNFLEYYDETISSKVVIKLPMPLDDVIDTELTPIGNNISSKVLNFITSNCSFPHIKYLPCPQLNNCLSYEHVAKDLLEYWVAHGWLSVKYIKY